MKRIENYDFNTNYNIDFIVFRFTIIIIDESIISEFRETLRNQFILFLSPNDSSYFNLLNSQTNSRFK